MILSQTLTAKAKLQAERFKNVVFANEVLRLSESELQSIIDSYNNAIEKAKLNPYFAGKTYRHIVNVLAKNGEIVKYIDRYLALDKVRKSYSNGRKPTNKYIDKYGIIYSRNDDNYHLKNKDGKLTPPEPPPPPTPEPQRQNAVKFDLSWVDDLPPPTAMPLRGVWLAPSHPDHRPTPCDYWQAVELDLFGKISQNDKAEPIAEPVKTAPIIENEITTILQNVGNDVPFEPSIINGSSVKLITTQQHQTTPLNKAIKQQNEFSISQETYLKQLEQVISTLPHGNTLKDLVPEYVIAKDEQQAYAKAHAPINHRICTCCDGAGDIHIKGNKLGKIKVTGVYRCENPFEPHCYHYDSQYQLKRAIDLQEAWLASGGEWYLLTFDCPHTWKDKLETIVSKIQSAFEQFMQEIKRLLPDVDLSHYLKRLEYAISRLNGHHPHIHLALGLPPLPQDEIERIKAIMHRTWLKYLAKVGLLNNRNKANATKYAFDMRKHDRACEYVVKRHKVAHTKAEIKKLHEKWLNGETLTIFEYMSLARYGKVSERQFTKNYHELLHVLGGKQLIKYSNGFERKLGLSELVKPKTIAPPKLLKNKPYEPIYSYQNTFGFDEPPVKEIRYQKRHKGAGRKPKKLIVSDCQLTLPEIEQIYEQAVATTATAKKPYWRPKSHPANSGDWQTLVKFDKEVWKYLTKNHAHRIVLSMIERDFKAGRFSAKPNSYYQQHPRPS